MRGESHHTFAQRARGAWSHDAVILSDVTKSGRERPWHICKSRSEAAAAALIALGGKYEQKGRRIKKCGENLAFRCQEVGGRTRKRLVEAEFCKCRECETCQWRRSLVLQHQLETVIEEYYTGHDEVDGKKKSRAKDIPLFVTLTMENVPGSELEAAVDHLLASFDRLRRYERITRFTKAWFKRVETSKDKYGNFHPHIHAIFMAPRNYFKEKHPDIECKNGVMKEDKRNLYLTQERLTSLWQRALKVDYKPICDMRRIGERKMTTEEQRKAINEVAKYTVKPAGIYWENWDHTWRIDQEDVRVLSDAFEGRRLVGWGGLFTDIRRALKLVDAEDQNADLILTKDEVLTEDGQVMTKDGELLDVGPSWLERYGRKRVYTEGPRLYVRTYTDRYRNDWEGEEVGPRPEGGTKADPPPIIH